MRSSGVHPHMGAWRASSPEKLLFDFLFCRTQEFCIYSFESLLCPCTLCVGILIEKLPATMLNGGNLCYFLVCLGLLSRQRRFLRSFEKLHSIDACGDAQCFPCVVVPVLQNLANNTDTNPRDISFLFELFEQSNLASKTTPMNCSWS